MRRTNIGCANCDAHATNAGAAPPITARLGVNDAKHNRDLR